MFHYPRSTKSINFKHPVWIFGVEIRNTFEVQLEPKKTEKQEGGTSKSFWFPNMFALSSFSTRVTCVKKTQLPTSGTVTRQTRNFHGPRNPPFTRHPKCHGHSLQKYIFMNFQPRVKTFLVFRGRGRDERFLMTLTKKNSVCLTSLANYLFWLFAHWITETKCFQSRGQ